MAKPAWTPWHKVLKIRPDLKSGELPLNIFAADLYDVATGAAKPIYQRPEEFFALTYPTYSLRELAKEVALRLAGKSEKAVRQLQLTYGGGKTHSLITLWHLFDRPDQLPDLPAVREFKESMGIAPPPARIAILPFDKLDPEKGMEAQSPDGEKRWLKYPWSVLAFEIAGAEGLRLLHPDEKEAERESVPFQNLLETLFQLPAKQGLATLILIDEVLMYAREKVRNDRGWLGALGDFFQGLTQAASKVDRCAVVASLLATDPAKYDEQGRQIVGEIRERFGRQQEAAIEPVAKSDVAEVLRRRLFAPESIQERSGFRAAAAGALKGIEALDESTKKDAKAMEDRIEASYPFHPELIEVFYTKWTSLEGFQRTRGVLRTFALALRDAENWDQCPLVGANVFLGTPDADTLGEAAQELATIATTEQYEGRRQEWAPILSSELARARDIQLEIPGLKFREIEQAVFATFLHSQPAGHKAQTRDLMLLLGPTRPDKIELERGLNRWADTSWFLDEEDIGDPSRTSDERKPLPKAWRLGVKPNLRQMHAEACKRISPEITESRLLDEIGKAKTLTAGAGALGARVHTLPDKPSDIPDDGEFHYAVLKPNAASDPDRPSSEAKRFINETTAADRLRTNRNALVLAVPSKNGLDAARARMREALGWEEVADQLREQIKKGDLDPIRLAILNQSVKEARERARDAIKQAYCICITVGEDKEIQGFRVALNGSDLFAAIKADSRSRIQDTAVNVEALLPEGPYDLWREGETARRLKDLVGAFAANPELPKMLNRGAIEQTLVLGCQQGQFVLRASRPDRSMRTFWRQMPDEAALKDPTLEVVLPEAAELVEIAPTLLAKGELPGLWEGDGIAVKTVAEYFRGGNVVKIKKNTYEEPLTIPKASKETVARAIRAAVEEGNLWLTFGQASILGEEIPPGLLTDETKLAMPPEALSTVNILPGVLREAWPEETTSAMAILSASSARAGKNLPWTTVREAIEGALRVGMLERAPDSGPWPCDLSGAQNVRLRLPSAPPPPPPPRPPRPSGMRLAESELKPNEIQELADQIGEIRKAAVGLDLKFRIGISVADGSAKLSDETVKALNQLLAKISRSFQLR